MASTMNTLLKNWNEKYFARVGCVVEELSSSGGDKTYTWFYGFGEGRVRVMTNRKQATIFVERNLDSRARYNKVYMIRNYIVLKGALEAIYSVFAYAGRKYSSFAEAADVLEIILWAMVTENEISATKQDE